jgi:hypothetical protein
MSPKRLPVFTFCNARHYTAGFVSGTVDTDKWAEWRSSLLFSENRVHTKRESDALPFLFASYNLFLLRLYLSIIQFDRRLASEDRDLDLQLLFVFVDLLDLRAEAGEWSVDNLHGLAHVVANFR